MIPEDEPIRMTGASRTRSSVFEERLKNASSRGQGKKPEPDKLAPMREAATKIGPGPRIPKYLEIKTENGTCLLPAGFHLVTGGTGSGKTVTSVALTILAKTQDYPSLYIYQWEARASLNKEVNPISALALNLPKRLQDAFTHKNPTKDKPIGRFMDEVRVAASRSGTAGLLVIDSVSLPMRMYTGDDPLSRSGQATMKEGMQPMDITFVEKMEALAIDNDIAILGLVNADLVPFASKLEGITEGIIDILPNGRANQRNRTVRRMTEFTVGKDARKIAAEWLGYRGFDADNTGSSIPGYTGLTDYKGRI